MNLKELLYNVNIIKIKADLEIEVKSIQWKVSGIIINENMKDKVAILKNEPKQLYSQYILVDDARLAFSIICANYYGNPSKKIKVIGVTGTNGKTTTTYLIKQLLEKCFNTKVGLMGTICNMIGDEVVKEGKTDLTTSPSNITQYLLKEMVNNECEYCVMEVTSHSLAWKRAYSIDYDIGVFTNIGRDHLDFHKTIENYVDAKSKLFPMCKKVVGNKDDEWYNMVMKNCKCKPYTISIKDKNVNLYAENICLYKDKVVFDVVENNLRINTFIQMPGEFSVYNALSAIACLRLEGANLKDICKYLPLCKCPKGRAEKIETNSDFDIYIDYAVTPDSLKCILNTFKPFVKGRLVLLFGCGGNKDIGKRQLMGEIASELADFIIVTSDNPRYEDKNKIIKDIIKGIKNNSYIMISDRKEAIRYAIKNHQPNDLILLCGKGHEDYQIIGGKKIHMDEREIIEEILNSGYN